MRFLNVPRCGRKHDDSRSASSTSATFDTVDPRPDTRLQGKLGARGGLFLLAGSSKQLIWHG